MQLALTAKEMRLTLQLVDAIGYGQLRRMALTREAGGVSLRSGEYARDPALRLRRGLAATSLLRCCCVTLSFATTAGRSCERTHRSRLSRIGRVIPAKRNAIGIIQLRIAS